MLTPDTVSQYLQARQLLLDKFPAAAFVSLDYDWYRFYSGIEEYSWSAYVDFDDERDYIAVSKKSNPLAAVEELIKQYDKRGI